MTLQQLRYIVAVNRLRSFAKAADSCDVSQPTLSAMLVKLEEELDIRLFNRKIEGDYLSQRRISLYIKADFIRQQMLNTIVDTLKTFMPKSMFGEGIWKYGIKL